MQKYLCELVLYDKMTKRELFKKKIKNREVIG